MNSNTIREKYLAFFKQREHIIIPSASLVPENDPSVLFTTAGMQPLVPYLLGEEHPSGKRLVGIQKCVRTQDIDEVGDNIHNTFFEMLGNWSLGDYFKEDAIKWSYEFLTSRTEGLGLDPKRLYVTVFAGNADAPRDKESFEIWRRVGIPEKRIYFMPAASNWWSAGENGPGGPDTEMFYDTTGRGLGDMSREEFLKADERQEVIEIWNDVFMEYLLKDGKVVGKLQNKNVDTGAGLERMAVVLQKKNNLYETDLFSPLMAKIAAFTRTPNIRAARIIADHLRAAVFMISDGVTPSNTDRGYVLRRLLRRAIRYGDVLGLKNGSLLWLADSVIESYEETYGDLRSRARAIKKEIEAEEGRFRKTLATGLKMLERVGTNDVSAETAFLLFSSYGLPIDIIVELAKEKGVSVDIKGFEAALKNHQKISRAGVDKKFKGGLADHSSKVIQYHTATHLLHQALHDVLGSHIEQRGSNITAERLRFDFAHAQKMTEEEKLQVEKIVNEKIKGGLPVSSVILPRAEAEKSGARHFFGEKYGGEVKVYFIGQSLDSAYSKEFCGGPHVGNTSELKGIFKIEKEEAVSAGIRRIKAVLET